MASQLFFLSLAEIFSVYPTIFKELLSTRAKPTLVFLPSDAEWQEKVYCRLLDVQRRINDALDNGMEFEEVMKRRVKPVFDPLRASFKVSPSPSPSPSPSGLSYVKRKTCSSNAMVYPKSNCSWSLNNIAKAAKLLRKPPLCVQFQNEHEMRKVFSLIYDVFRYKVVLSNALNDVSFYTSFPQFKNDEKRIWLMLYELFDRHFRKRNVEEIDLQSRLYQDSEVEDISDCLWKSRIRLSASISRMRIRHGALCLSQLLPIHLQNEKVAIAASNPIVTGWINPFLLRDKTSADKFLGEMGLELQLDDTNEAQPLQTNQYKWDTVCPLFLSCIPKDRNEFTKSCLMTKHYFVMQDRTFSFGPAVMAKLLDFFELDGDILQTHISSPRSTAYLAALFYSVNRVNNFYVYGAALNLKEWRNYMDILGVTNIRIFAEPFISFPLESKRFGTVVGIFACPPNSFSAISDPIDLICSRGGDLSMLEVLTESEISEEGKRRVSLILEEQLLTLQMAMSRPHTQFILYQTHSIVHSENQEMVQYTVDLINKISLEKHRCAFREMKRLEALAEAEAANIPSAAVAVNSPRKRNVPSSLSEDKSKSQPCEESCTETTSNPVTDEHSVESVVLPPIDEFVFEDVPDICINRDNCMRLQSNGCFFSLIKRKSITHLNAKYLIKMAESRGLFGKGEGSKLTKSKSSKAQEVNLDKPNQSQQLSRGQHKTCTNVNNLINRLLQHTNASCNRSNLDRTQNYPIIFNCRREACFRFLKPLSFQSWTSPQRTKFRWTLAFKFIQQWRTTDRKRSLYKHEQTAKLHMKKDTKRTRYPIHITQVGII